MFGKTKEQLQTRWKISFISAIVIILIMFIIQFAFGASLTWLEFIIMLLITVIAYPVYIFGLLVDWRTQFVEPFKKTRPFPVLIWFLVFFFFYMLAGFKVYYNGFRALLYMFSSGE